MTDARPDQLIFNWSQIDPSCSAVQYQNTSDCGRCSLATPTSTLANCYDLQLSTTVRNCTFSVGSEICGFTGPSSDPVTVTLKGMLLSIMSRAWTRLSTPIDPYASYMYSTARGIIIFSLVPRPFDQGGEERAWPLEEGEKAYSSSRHPRFSWGSCVCNRYQAPPSGPGYEDTVGV